tara:strand:+ start:462 stop:1124 length:663 start_codon:yes stop_codon:yes gene_type:complete
MANESLTKLLNKGVIKIKRKKTMKKNTSNSAKKYNDFLKKRRSMSNIKNPIDSIITQSVKDMKSIPNIKAIEKPVNQKLVTKVQSYDKPKIDIKMPKNIMPKTEKEIKKVTVVEDVKQPVFSFDRSKKLKQKKKYMKKKKSVKKKKTKRKPRKITFTVKKTKKNTCDKFKKMKSEVQTKKPNDMVKELKDKGINISGKSNKLLKDVYMCVVNDNMNIKKE